MKTNIFYKIAAVINSPSKLEGVPAGGGSLSATDFTDSLRFARPSNLEGQLKCKATLLCTLCSVLLLASCTQDSIIPEYADAPLTISATIPGDVWAVASRADDGVTDAGVAGTAPTYSDWTLHYTDYTGAAAAYALTSVSEDGTNVSFTTGEDLVWAKVDATRPMHLTALYDNGTPDDNADDYTLHTSVATATAGQPLAFPDAMKPTVAMLTVNFTLSHNMTNNPSHGDFTISVSARAAADSYNPMTAFPSNVWPAAEGDTTATTFTLSEMESVADGTYTVTGTMLLPQQVMGETLTVTYGSNSWSLDLSTVTVSGSSIEQRANQLFAGQHLTLNLSAGLTSLNAPSDIKIEAFTAASASDYNPDLGGVAKTYEYDAATNTYYIYHEKLIEAALADRAANNRTTAKVMINGVEWTVVEGAEEDLETMQAAIAGKTHIIVAGETLAVYDGTVPEFVVAETVVGEAIRLLTNEANGESIEDSPYIGTISLVLPSATTRGDYAFFDCSAIKSVSAPKAISIGEYAFYFCDALTSVELPAATSIGKLAFYYCSDLTSVEFPLATSIEFWAFRSCDLLTSVSLPAATTIGDRAFYSCVELVSVSAPKVTTIGKEAFNECFSLTTLTFGSVITSVGTDAFGEAGNFYGCDLTLAAGQQHMTDGTPNGTAVTAADASTEAADRTWADNAWKSITLK